MTVTLQPPQRVPYRYGLLPTSDVVDLPQLRLHSNMAFDSVACNTGIIWEPECAAPFTATLTKGAVADTLAVAVSPGVVANYQVSVNGGAFSALGATLVSAAAAPVTVAIREASGLVRSVTRTDVDFDAAGGTVFTFLSSQTNNLPKTITAGINSRAASPFVVIGGVSCTRIASPDLPTQAREALASVEQRKVEQRFWLNQLALGAPNLPLGGGVVPLTTAVAGLEQYLRDQTGSEGTLHSDAFVAPFAAKNRLISDQHSDGVRKRTALYTRWAFGGGYDRTGPSGQAAPAADQAWIYATGPVVVYRGPVDVPGDGVGGFNTTTNQDFVLAERPYVVIPDCPLAAVLADVDA